MAAPEAYMKPVLIVLAVLALAAPAHAQLMERGVARTGTVQQSTPGGSAFMCRLSCSLNAACSGWSWVRPGADGPQARCELLSGEVATKPDSCCDSGLSGNVGTPVAAAGSSSMFRGNQYAGLSQDPGGPPVQLVNVPGGMWEQGEEEDEAEEESEAEETAPAVTQTADGQQSAQPTARVTSMPRGSGPPRYSVQREYSGQATQPQADPQGMADPSRWLGAGG